MLTAVKPDRLLSPAATRILHASGHEQRLQAGDVLHVELIPKVRHYSARLMRPLIVGEISAARALAQQLIAIQDRQLRAMKPGVAACTVDAVAREAVLSAGLREDYSNITGYALVCIRAPASKRFKLLFSSSGAVVTGGKHGVSHVYFSAGPRLQ